MRLDFADHAFSLLPDRAVYWPSQKTLLCSDIHFGKEEIFRQHGVALPSGSDQRDLERLSTQIAQHKPDQLIVLGDFLHGALASDSPFIAHFDRWRKDLSHLALTIIRGNHDRNANEHHFPNTTWLTETTISTVRLIHEPPGVSGTVPTLCGHLHPTYTIQHSRIDRLRFPVFWKTANALILPAFGELTAGLDITPELGDQLFVAGKDEVIEITQAISA